ncbi:MAG: M48 family metalloprotease, partial [Quisquiliibacterium sp.]
MNPNLAFARWCSLLALAAVLGACQVTRPPPAANYSLDRAQRSAMLVWEPEIRAPALAVYEQALDRARKQGRLNADSAMAARVRVVAQRVIRASSAFRPDATSWNWEVNLIDSGQLTAWCLPAGKIAVHSGLLTALDLTDDELAAVIAHEIAHALREHASERISELVTSGPGGSAASAGAQPGARDLVALLQRVTFSLPYSAIQETE